jgi:hypothetical protein
LGKLPLTLVAALVVAGQPRHQLLRVAVLDRSEELGRAAAAQDRGTAAVVRDHHRVAADLILETMRCGHRLSLVAGAILLAAAALAGCGGGGQGDTTDAGGAPGIKGERPGREAAGAAELSAADCAALAARLERRLGAAVRQRSEPSPPLSRCRIASPGAEVNVYLDAAYAARQRYKNRMVETAQFGAPDPAKLPHPVTGVGDSGGASASWVPAYHSLFAVRGNRWVTVAYAVAGEPERRLRAEAAALARAAFRLSAG